MKKFSDFSKSVRGKLPAIETVFGSHSRAKEKKLPAIETIFGSHSKKGKKKLKEDFDFLAESKAIEGVKKLKDDDDPHYHVADYTEDSHYVNSGLHGLYRGKTQDDSYKSEVKQFAHGISKALSPTTKDTHLYTGVPESPAEAWKAYGQDKKKPIRVHLPAFTSTSHDKEIARNFAPLRQHNLEDHPTRNTLSAEEKAKISKNAAGHILRIHAPKGTRAGYLEHITANPGEHETLLDRGHDIEIHPHPEYDSAKNTFTWHAKIVGHNPQKLD